MDAPFFSRAISSLRFAVNLYNQCKNDVDYTFCTVALDHAITLILLDKLDSKKEKIFEEDGHVINFHKSIILLSKNKGVPIPENNLLTMIHFARDGILHKGEIVSKHDSDYYIEKTLIFFKRFLKEEYGKFLPQSITSNTKLYKKTEPEKLLTLDQLLSETKTLAKNPIVIFNEKYEPIYSSLNLLGYKNNILKKDKPFNFANIKKLKKLDFISPSDSKLFSQSMMIYQQISNGNLDQNPATIKKLNSFLDTLANKIKKHSTNSLPKEVTVLDTSSLINLLYQSDNKPKRVKGKYGK